MGFGDSVRSTGFDADPGLGQRKSKLARSLHSRRLSVINPSALDNMDIERASLGKLSLDLCGTRITR